jgi:hypothetical protein
MNMISTVVGAARLLAPETPLAPPEPLGHRTVTSSGGVRATREPVGWWMTAEEADEALGRAGAFRRKARRTGYLVGAVATLLACYVAGHRH